MIKFDIKRFGGINLAEPKQELRPEECTDCRNVRITNESLLIRPGTTAVGTGLTAAQKIRSMASVRDVLFAVQGNNVKRLSGSTWVASGISGISTTSKPVFVEFPMAGPTISVNGTITSVLTNNLGVSDTSKSWTENQHMGYYLVIDGADSKVQIRYIVANTATELFLAEPLTSKSQPPVGRNYIIVSQSKNAVYFFNGQTPKYTYDVTTTAWDAFSNSTAPDLVSAVEYNDRLVGFKANSNKIYISSLLNGYDFPYDIEVGDPGKSITSISVHQNQLIIQKEDGMWITDDKDPTQYFLEQRSKNFGAVNKESVSSGENILFFVSNRGIETINTLEQDLLKGQKSTSDHRIPAIRSSYTKSDSQGISFRGLYYCSFPTDSKVVIFDILTYLQRLQEGKVEPYNFLIDTGYDAECFAVHDEELYIGQTGQVVKMNSSVATDDGTPIVAYWEKDGIIAGSTERDKMARFVNIITSGGTSTDSIDITLSSDSETKNLSNTLLTKDYNEIYGKHVFGRQHKLKIILSDFGSAKLENINIMLEQGKI